MSQMGGTFCLLVLLQDGSQLNTRCDIVNMSLEMVWNMIPGRNVLACVQNYARETNSASILVTANLHILTDEMLLLIKLCHE